MNKLKQLRYLLILLLGICVLAPSCSKDETPVKEEETITEEPIEEPEETDPTDNFYRLIRVENFKGVTDIEDPMAVQTTLFYSLEQNKPIDEKYTKTGAWDLAFGGLYQSFVSGNNGNNSSNHGAGAPSKGGILLLKQHFDEVIDIPVDSEFKTGKDLYGTDDSGDWGMGDGWYLYDFGGVIVRDGAYDNQHIAYPLGNPIQLKNGNMSGVRTIVVKTAKGSYAKIKMISVYKDLFEPEQWYRDAEKMYFTFEYVMVPAGSTQFEIK